MNKNIIIIIILFQSVALAQRFQYGIEISKNLETYTSSKHNIVQVRNMLIPFKSKHSYNAGINVVYNWNPQISILGSLSFTKYKVETWMTGADDGEVNVELNFKYISFSPQIVVNPIWGILLSMGPSMDFLVNSDFGGDYTHKIKGSNNSRTSLNMKLGYKIILLHNISVVPNFSHNLGLTETHSNLGKRYSSSRIGILLLFVGT